MGEVWIRGKTEERSAECMTGRKKKRRKMRKKRNRKRERKRKVKISYLISDIIWSSALAVHTGGILLSGSRCIDCI